MRKVPLPVPEWQLIVGAECDILGDIESSTPIGQALIEVALSHRAAIGAILDVCRIQY